MDADQTIREASPLPSEEGMLIPSFSQDVWGRILEFVPPHDLVKNVSKVSRHFRSITDSECLWNACSKIVVNDKVKWGIYDKHGVNASTLRLQQMCIFATNTEL